MWGSCRRLFRRQRLLETTRETLQTRKSFELIHSVNDQSSCTGCLAQSITSLSMTLNCHCVLWFEALCFPNFTISCQWHFLWLSKLFKYRYIFQNWSHWLLCARWVSISKYQSPVNASFINNKAVFFYKLILVQLWSQRWFNGQWGKKLNATTAPHWLFTDRIMSTCK